MGKLLPHPGRVDGARVSFDDAGMGFVGGASPSMRPVEAVIRELARSDVPVLLLAEPGAGKHTTARRIHEMSQRSEGTFLCLPCSRLAPEDLQSNDGVAGPLVEAGTVYFEEVAELTLGCQARLQKVWPQAGAEGGAGLGGARVICGSARDLEVEVKAGRLREDLYYRISGVCLRLPPLRQRKEDIPVLMKHFLGKYAQEFGREVPSLSAQTRRLFQDYAWPGNLKELEYAARVLVALGDEDMAMGGLRALLHKAPAGNGNGKGVSLKAASRAASHEAERDLILQALTRTRWNRRRAARELQISYKALLYKLKRIQFEGYGAS